MKGGAKQMARDKLIKDKLLSVRMEEPFKLSLEVCAEAVGMTLSQFVHKALLSYMTDTLDFLDAKNRGDFNGCDKCPKNTTHS